MRCFHLLLISLLVFSSCTSTIRDYRSLASYENECIKAAEKILRKNPIKSGPIKTDQNSLYSKIPNYEKYRDEMLEKRPSIENFEKKYKEKNGHSPTLREAVKFYFEATSNLIAHINSAKGNHKELDHYLAIFAREIDLSDKVKDRYKALIEDPSNNDFLDEIFDYKTHKHVFMELSWPNYKGHLGELDVLLRLRNVLAQGVYFKKMEGQHVGLQEINSLLNERVEETFKTINKDNLPKLMEKYPNVFKKTQDLAPDQIIAQAKSFIESKEIDIILKKDNKYIFVEVKNYKSPIGMKEAKLSDPDTNKKTILDQQMEDIEIINLLGLTDVIYPSIALLRGITPDALKVFEEYGISVLGRVHQKD